VRRAIVEYLEKLEESESEINSKDLLDELGEEFKKSLDELNFEKAIEGYEKMRGIEWRRTSTIQTN